MKSSLEAYTTRRLSLTVGGYKDAYPYCTPVEDLGVQRFGSAASSAKEVVSFAHYDYVGLSDHPRVLKAAKDAIDAQGVGVGASRLVGGETQAHRKLEAELSNFLGVEDTLVLVSGYGTNVALIGHILGKDDLLVLDEAVHSSVLAGAQLSRAPHVFFRHSDLNHLDSILTETRSRYKRVLVAIEGMYSMDGDVPDLPRFLEICQRHKAWTFVDEAHSIGVLGKGGRGIAQHYGIAPSEIDIIVGTLSKAFVGVGGFIAARKGVIDWLRYTLPGFVYSVGMAPASVATAREALRLLQEEPERLQQLERNSTHFKSLALDLGLNIGKSNGMAVIPVLFPTAHLTVEAANTALKAGYYVPPIVQIAIPKEEPRLRFFLTAKHSRSQIEGVLHAIHALKLQGVGGVAAC